MPFKAFFFFISTNAFWLISGIFQDLFGVVVRQKAQLTFYFTQEMDVCTVVQDL